MIRETEVDGVPTLIAPSSGPMAVGLLFRVGRVDETLANAGITHMVEHLALHRHGIADYHYNGTTCTYYTSFNMRGAETDVVSYLTGVCDSLADMPMHRLETEKSILRTEAAGRSAGVNQAMPLWRYGARGHGIVSYPEFGVLGLQPGDVEDWVQRWFTRDNAVLWIAGDGVPAGLKLNLRSGRRMPVPAATSALPVSPAFFNGEDGGVVLDAVVPHRMAAQMYAGVLERELFRSLRQEGGYSYAANASYDHRGDGFGIVTAVADALPKMQDAVVGGFIDVLAKLKAGRIAEADINAVRGQALENFGHPDMHAARLAGQAVGVLTGRPRVSLEQLRESISAISVADVHDVAMEIAESALVQVPHGHDVSWAGFTQAPIWSTTRVDGTRYQALDFDDVKMSVGTQGISQLSAQGSVTVLFAECEVMLAWPDGARRLVGSDGITIHFEPTLFSSGHKAVAAIDAGVPKAKIATMLARDPAVIPTPERKKRKPANASQRRDRIEAVAATAVTAIVLYVFISMANAWTPADGEWAEKVTIGMMFLSAGCLIWLFSVPIRWLWNRRR